MFRLFATAAILSLSVGAAQAGETSLTAKVHAAAVKACAPVASASLPASHYNTITETCIARVSRATMVKLQRTAEARTSASTALNLN